LLFGVLIKKVVQFCDRSHWEFIEDLSEVAVGEHSSEFLFPGSHGIINILMAAGNNCDTQPQMINLSGDPVVLPWT